MVSRQFTEEDVFNVARRLTDADAQAQYLEQICHDNPARAARVEVLLKRTPAKSSWQRHRRACRHRRPAADGGPRHRNRAIQAS